MDDLVAILAECEQVVFLGVASTADEGLRLLDELAPDLVLVDIDDEGLRTEQAVKRILARRPGIAVVGMTTDVDAPWIGEVIRHGLTAVVKLSEDGGKQLVVDVCVLAASLGGAGEQDAPRAGA